MSKIKYFDNHISENDMQWLEKELFSENFPYYYQSSITSFDNEYMFTHNLIKDCKSNSDWAEPILSKIMEKISHQQIIRAKVNLYSKTDKIVVHPFHTDSDIEHKVALFYINTNDGYTEFESTERVNSNRNRILFFDGNKRHRSTTCTNSKIRINININYK